MKLFLIVLLFDLFRIGIIRINSIAYLRKTKKRLYTILIYSSTLEAMLIIISTNFMMFNILISRKNTNKLFSRHFHFGQ